MAERHSGRADSAPALTAEEGGRPRLAFYLPALASGGMEQVTLVLARELAELGHAVDLVLEHRQGGYLDRVPANVGLIELTKGSKWPAYARLIHAFPRGGLAQLLRMLLPGNRYVPLRRLLSLVRYLREYKPAVLFAAHGRIPLLAIWAARIAGGATRVIVTEHSTLSRWFEVFSDQPATLGRLEHRRALARQLYPQAAAIVAVSTGVADDLARTLDIDRQRVTTIYNPVVSQELTDRAQAPLDHEWFGDGGPPVVLAVGRLVREKNFSALIEAFAQMRRHYPARLMILGEGPERQALEAQVRTLQLETDIVLPGWADNPYAYMRRSALFVLCSMFEGLGVVLVEAMACGCPVVSVDCPSGPREILADGRYGRLVPMNKPAALAEAMSATLESPLPVVTLQARAGEFSVVRSVAAYQRLIDEVTGWCGPASSERSVAA